ncbi:MAG TPA: hypothetical protein VGN12_05890 [Pirellulales bacterium]
MRRQHPLRAVFISAFCAILLAATGTAHAQRLLVQGNDKLAIVDRDGTIEWQMP